MLFRNPVLKVWGLPKTEEVQYVGLHADLVAAIASIPETKVKTENDLIVLFPADLMTHGLGSQVLVEYVGIEEYDWQYRDQRKLLAAKLGNVLKKYVPAAFIQCEVHSGDRKDCQYWMSTGVATRDEIVRIQGEAIKLLPKFQQLAREKCYCESNATDLKGACEHHNVLGAYENVISTSVTLLSPNIETHFQEIADVFVAGVRNNTSLRELHSALGW